VILFYTHRQSETSQAVLCHMAQVGLFSCIGLYGVKGTGAIDMAEQAQQKNMVYPLYVRTFSSLIEATVAGDAIERQGAKLLSVYYDARAEKTILWARRHPRLEETVLDGVVTVEIQRQIGNTWESQT
jgi:hypothetical protein